MRKIQILLLMLLFLFPGPAPCPAATADGEAAAKAMNAFALDLYGQIQKSEDNLIFSPYSVSMCLAMAYAGARGNTASQMAKALHFSVGQKKVSEAFGALSTEVLAAGNRKGVEINIANALWAEKSYPFLKEYLESVGIHFAQPGGWFSLIPLVSWLRKSIGSNSQEELRQLDFRHNPEPARKMINSWVEEQTRNKITNLLAPETINELTRLVLTNAIYFKGVWESKFEKKRTREAPFTLLDGKQVMVPMMGQAESFGYAEGPELQVLEIPYKGGQLAMVVLLPSKQRRLEDFEHSVTLRSLDQQIGKLSTQPVEVYLPRFKTASTFQLRTALNGLGMTDAFSPDAADFSGMTGTKDLFIGGGVHKAFVEVNEEGTEAAAASGKCVQITGAPPRLPVFRADHPFLFLIRHKPSGSILFLGRVTNP